MKTLPNQTASESAPSKRDYSPSACLFPELEPPIAAALWPKPETNPGDALARMLTGERLTQPSYGFQGWRLAAYIKELEYLGWAIQRADVPAPPKYKVTRPIRMYWLAQETIREALSCGRAS